VAPARGHAHLTTRATASQSWIRGCRGNGRTTAREPIDSQVIQEAGPPSGNRPLTSGGALGIRTPDSSMPWAGVALMVYAERPSFPYLQGIFALLVVASLPYFKIVVAPGSLPKSSHGGSRSIDLPTCARRTARAFGALRRAVTGD
jgi:hypothetical protein